MKRNHLILPALLLFFSLFSPSKTNAQSTEPVVRALLFYSTSCPHCHQVIQNDLPPLFEKYGEQLDMIGIDISLPEGQIIYQAAIQRFSIPENRLGVPTLIIGNIVLVGSMEIPEQFPGLVDHYLSLGGVDWPDIPGLSEAIPQTDSNPSTATSIPQAQALQATPVPATTSPLSASPTATPGLILAGDQNSDWRDKLARDPIGNMLAIIVLITMLMAVPWTIILFRNQTGNFVKEDISWIIPVLCMIGFGVAGYMTYVETAQVAAVCGPVGDCNTVQQSEYARLFGVMPIGLLGLIGYIAISTAWIFARFINGSLANLARLALLAMTVSGTLFSIYLTFLEPFVIGATCAWCLTSAIIMTSLMLLSTRPAKLAFSNMTLSNYFHRDPIQTGANNDD